MMGTGSGLMGVGHSTLMGAGSGVLGASGSMIADRDFTSTAIGATPMSCMLDARLNRSTGQLGDTEGRGGYGLRMGMVRNRSDSVGSGGMEEFNFRMGLMDRMVGVGAQAISLEEMERQQMMSLRDLEKIDEMRKQKMMMMEVEKRNMEMDIKRKTK